MAAPILSIDVEKIPAELEQARRLQQLISCRGSFQQLCECGGKGSASAGAVEENDIPEALSGHAFGGRESVGWAASFIHATTSRSLHS